MKNSVLKRSKGITKILSFWDEQLQFKKISKEENKYIDLVIKMVINGELYSTKYFAEFPKKMVPFIEGISADKIIVNIKKFQKLLNNDKIKKERFSKNNNIIVFFLGDKNKKIPSYYLRTRKYDVVDKKLKGRERLKIESAPTVVISISKDINKMLIMWNNQTCFKKIIVNQKNPSKKLKKVVFLLGKYLSGDLYSTNKLAVFPNGVDPFKMKNCKSLKQWGEFLEKFKIAITDKTVYPKEKITINKYSDILNFLIGSTYSKYPSPSYLLSYCLNEPIKHTDSIIHKMDIINKLISIYKDMVPKYEFKEEDIIIFDKCLLIMEEVIKEVGTSDSRHPVAIGVGLFNSAIKSAWKNPGSIKSLNYIRSGSFKTLFMKFYKKEGGINNGC